MADSNETRELISVRDLILIGGGGREKGEGDGHLTSEEEGSGEMPFLLHFSEEALFSSRPKSESGRRREGLGECIRVRGTPTRHHVPQDPRENQSNDAHRR